MARVAGSVLGVAFALLSLSVLSCAPKAGGPGGGGFKMPPTPVEVADVRSQVVRDEFHAVGSIESDDNIQVVSEVSGAVRELPFTEGQAVAAGAVLAQLDDREYAADAKRTEAQRVLAAANFDRSEKLFEQNAIAASERDNSKAELAVAEANASLAKVRFEKTRIRAPFDGAVGARKVSVGTYVREGDAITDLARLSTLKVSFAAPERLLAELKPGRTVQVSTPAFPGQRFDGQLSVVNPMLDADTRTVRLVARIPNTGGRLRPGLSADVSIAVAERAKGLTIPDEAVFAEGSQNFVYVVKADSSVVRTAVQLGTRDSSRVEIVHGLEAGQRVVSAGHQKLFDGAHIMPVSGQ
jgi:membrane fusion protein, multidrug efflux system